MARVVVVVIVMGRSRGVLPIVQVRVSVIASCLSMGARSAFFK